MLSIRMNHGVGFFLSGQLGGKESACGESCSEVLIMKGVFLFFFFFQEGRRATFFFFGGFGGNGIPTTHFAYLSKGNRVKIPEPGRKDIFCGNANEPREVSEGPGKSSLFFLTIVQHRNGIGSVRDGRLFWLSWLFTGSRRLEEASCFSRARSRWKNTPFEKPLQGGVSKDVSSVRCVSIRWPWNQVDWRKGETIGRASRFRRCPVHLR